MYEEGASEHEPVFPILRRVDFLDLFDTSADLAGNDVDVSRWIRATDDRTVQVAWRAIETDEQGGRVPADGERLAGRAELCPVPIEEARQFVKDHGGFVYDQETSTWEAVSAASIRPGIPIVLDAATGGYRPDLGWAPSSRSGVEPVSVDGPAVDGMAQDQGTRIGGHWVGLGQHLFDVASEVAVLRSELGGLDGLTSSEWEAAERAGAMHDLGKAHPTFDERVRTSVPGGPPPDAGVGPFAKSPARHWKRSETVFRHELASALMLLGGAQELIADCDLADLVVYLVAAHHGLVRMSLRTVPSDARLAADRQSPAVLGVVDGDVTLPVGLIDGPAGATRRCESVKLSLGPERIGYSPDPSWATRATQLLATHGPFRLAFLEAVVRMADWRASAKYDEHTAAEVQP
jgi:CRISPR-associated endonuclease/helicase Cas3